MRHHSLAVALGAVLALGAFAPATAKQNAERCAGAKSAATSRLAAARLACLRASLLNGGPVSEGCVAKAAAKFITKLERIEGKGGCRSSGDGTALTGLVDALVEGVGGILAAGTATTTTLTTPTTSTTLGPTEGALRVTWVFHTGSTTLTCDAVTGQTVSVLLTRQGSVDSIDQIFPCADGQGDIPDLPFGTYTVVVSVFSASMQLLGDSMPEVVTFSSDPCDLLISGDCGRTLNADVQF